jgi:hypothetical protein
VVFSGRGGRTSAWQQAPLGNRHLLKITLSVSEQVDPGLLAVLQGTDNERPWRCGVSFNLQVRNELCAICSAMQCEFFWSVKWISGRGVEEIATSIKSLGSH